MTQHRTQTRQHEPATYSLWQMTAYALKLGAVGFGGPVALVGYMHRDLVEDRGWLTQDDYDEGFALAQLSPGPLAAQLAIYLGYCHYGQLGAALVGVAFALPSFVIVLAFSIGYVAAGGTPWLQAIFYTVGACIIGIIARSAEKLTRKIVGRDLLLWAIWSVLAVTTFVTERESIPLIVLAGVVTWLVKAPPGFVRRLTPGGGAAVLPLLASGAPVTLAATPGPVSGSLLLDIALFFGKAGAFVFGSGLAIVPFLFGGVVQELQWLTEQQFLDAVAVALITPGPVVITTAFIGFLVAGYAGATVAALATFLPCYLFTVIPAPYMRRYGRVPSIYAAVQGVTAAATGAIGGAVLVLGRRSVYGLTTALVAAGTYLLLWKGLGGRHLPEPVIVLFARRAWPCPVPPHHAVRPPPLPKPAAARADPAIRPSAFVFRAVTVDTPAGPILRHVDAEVPDAGVTVVAGPSGAGKSTLLRLCNRLEVPTQGQVWYRNRDVADQDPLALRREVGMVFQRPVLFAGTVADNLLVAAPDASDDELAAILERVALAPRMLDRAAATLSGGEAQRMSLARALITGPRVLLADEPTAALDARPRLAFERLARSLADNGLTVVWVTHDLDQLRRLADHVLVLVEGRCVHTGSADTLATVGGEARMFLAGSEDGGRDAR